MTAKDYTERLSAFALSVGLIIPRGKCVSGHVSERVFFFLRYATEIPWPRLRTWEDDVQGLDMAMSTVASEKNRELLFTGKVCYKQWHLCVLFH